MDWKDNYTLFSTDVQTAPENARLHAMYAKQLCDIVEAKYANTDPERDSSITQDPQMLTTVDEYRKAIGIYPYHAFVNGLGTALNQQRRFDEAKYYFKKAIAVNDSVPDYYHNLGIAYFGMKQYDSSAWAYEKVLYYSPNYTKTFVNLANVYNILKRHNEAITFIRKAIAQTPADRRLYMNLCVYFRDMGQADSANYYYKIATGR
jgi:tetratricopeptide (TPR) repeat protein